MQSLKREVADLKWQLEAALTKQRDAEADAEAANCNQRVIENLRWSSNLTAGGQTVEGFSDSLQSQGVASIYLADLAASEFSPRKVSNNN